MKKIMSIFVLCLLATAVMAVVPTPAAEHNPTGNPGDKDDTSSGLLRTERNYVVIREVIGQGADREQAIKNALYNAVSQVRGVKVDSGSYEFVFRGGGAGIGADRPGGTRLEFGSVDVATKGTAYTTEIGGLVKTYDVLEEKQIDENTHQVKVRVSV
ncbi:MAG TPA: hypothetical protein HPP66_08430, partial [Planctomycetes bacterium]|nr:hypothetical protein [Planctomycetota bacterium]